MPEPHRCNTVINYRKKGKICQNIIRNRENEEVREREGIGKMLLLKIWKRDNDCVPFVLWLAPDSTREIEMGYTYYIKDEMEKTRDSYLPFHKYEKDGT